MARRLVLNVLSLFHARQDVHATNRNPLDFFPRDYIPISPRSPRGVFRRRLEDGANLDGGRHRASPASAGAAPAGAGHVARALGRLRGPALRALRPVCEELAERRKVRFTCVRKRGPELQPPLKAVGKTPRRSAERRARRAGGLRKLRELVCGARRAPHRVSVRPKWWRLSALRPPRPPRGFCKARARQRAARSIAHVRQQEGRRSTRSNPR